VSNGSLICRSSAALCIQSVQENIEPKSRGDITLEAIDSGSLKGFPKRADQALSQVY